MGDVYDHEKRSEIMRHIKSMHNKSTELRLINEFYRNKITGWRRSYQVKGHPDFVFLKKRVAIFVDGCFWHGHDCRNTRPATNQEYWNRKLDHNILHDNEVTARFEKRGWKVLRIWECQLKKDNIKSTLARLQEALGNNA